ncbi:MAG: SDR family oxidoreductase [Steroidobacteraceae bacterium]
MTNKIAVVTNVSDYAGPPAVAALVADGFHVLGHSPRFADATARREFESEHPHRIASATESVEDVVKEALERFGRIDVAISNDAGETRQGPIQERSTQDFRNVLEAFTVAPFRLISAVVPHMRAQSSGRIILITSGAPLRPMPNMSLYSAARAAANMLVRTLATEIGAAGIAINAIAPYLLLSNYFPDGMDNPDFAQMVHSLVPMKRPGQPEEIGALISLLASGKADFISGQVIGFSGGGA